MLDCGMQRAHPLVRFLLFWAVHTLTLWVAGQVFSTVHFAGFQALLVAGLLFGLVNATVKPILVILTAPITVVTLGLFLLVINALMPVVSGQLSKRFIWLGEFDVRAVTGLRVSS